MPRDDVERPHWADPDLGICGFTTRGGVGVAALSCEKQLHGRLVHVVDDAPPPDGDGLWTTTPGVAVAVRVADCVPVLLWDPGVPAVAAVHAGWRGTAQDIVGEAVTVGRSLGVVPHRLFAAIGPSIGPCCFEVGDEVVDGLRGLALSDDALGLRTGPRGRPHVDLRSTNRALLLRAGLQDDRIEDVGGCTRCHPDKYESYRRDGAASGRMRGIIALALLTLMLALAGCADEPTRTDTEIAALTEEAQQAVASGDGARAEAILRPLLELRPGDAWLRAVLARALHRQGRYREAAVQSRIAIGADPTLWQAAYNLACHHAAMGESDEAIGWLQSALASGRLRDEDVFADPDLAPLESDHRFGFYQGTGVLMRAEEDAIALLPEPTVAVGEMATLTLIVIALNRPLMAQREKLSVRLRGPLPPDVVIPVGRSETFSTGVEGGREYVQRTLQFGFEVTKPGFLALGPFEVVQGERTRYTGTVLLEVTEGTPSPSSGPVPGFEDPMEFFAAPSSDDARLRAAHESRGGDSIEIDALGEAPAEHPWAQGQDGSSRVFRFKAATIEALPATIPEREEGVVRSILVQRATEGRSHLVEVKAARGETGP